MVDSFVALDSIKDILGLPSRTMLWTRHSAIIFEVDKRCSEYIPTFLSEEVFENREVVNIAEEVDMGFLFGYLFEVGDEVGHESNPGIEGVIVFMGYGGVTSTTVAEGMCPHSVRWVGADYVELLPLFDSSSDPFKAILF